jgi:hypothetical protein
MTAVTFPSCTTNRAILPVLWRTPMLAQAGVDFGFRDGGRHGRDLGRRAGHLGGLRGRICLGSFTPDKYTYQAQNHQEHDQTRSGGEQPGRPCAASNRPPAAPVGTHHRCADCSPRSADRFLPRSQRLSPRAGGSRRPRIAQLSTCFSDSCGNGRELLPLAQTMQSGTRLCGYTRAQMAVITGVTSCACLVRCVSPARPG